MICEREDLRDRWRNGITGERDGHGSSHTYAVLGIFCLSAADAIHWHSVGATFLALGSDSMLLVPAV